MYCFLGIYAIAKNMFYNIKSRKKAKKTRKKAQKMLLQSL